MLSNLINKTSILDFFIITRLSLLLLIRLNDNPLVSKKYIGLTACFNFILITSDGRRIEAFLIYLTHPVATVSLVYRLLTYEKRIGNEGTNFTWHTHVCSDVLDVHVCKAYKHQKYIWIPSVQVMFARVRLGRHKTAPMLIEGWLIFFLIFALCRRLGQQWMMKIVVYYHLPIFILYL